MGTFLSRYGTFRASMMSYASSIGSRSSLFKIQAIQMDKLNTAIDLAKVWSLIHHFQYPMDKNPSLLPSTRICSLVFFFFFFFFLINTTLTIGEMTVESLIKNAWNLFSVLSQRKQNNIMQSNKYYKNIHES